jgi:hypothetical protein
MIVWVVTWNDYDDSSIEGVFGDHALATSFAEERRRFREKEEKRIMGDDRELTESQFVWIAEYPVISSGADLERWRQREEA